MVGAAATTASAAAATQRSPAAGASEGVGSQVKNLAFPPFLYLQDTYLCPGLVYIYTCFLACQPASQNFFPVFCGFYSEGCTQKTSGRARCNLSRWKTKMAETLVFLREFRSLTAGPAAHPGSR